MLRALVFWLFTSTSIALAQSVEIETYRGPQEVNINPSKVVVLDIAALDTLAALGVEVDGVVNPLYVPYLNAGSATAVGTLFEPNYEALAALAPELIIAGGRAHEVVPTLAELAPTIDMTIWEDTVGQGLSRLEAYGKIFDKQAVATAMAAELQVKIERARSSVADAGDVLILMTNGPKVSAYGSNGRFGWIHRTLSLSEAVPEVEQATHGEAVSFEFIKEANPDVLLVIDRLAAIGRESDGARATLDNALVRETNAWQHDRVIYLDSAPIYIANGGIQSLIVFLIQIIDAFEER